VTLEDTGAANSNTIVMDNATAASNTLTLTSGSNAATVRSSGGSGAAVAVTNDSLTGTSAGGFGIGVDANGVIEKTGGSGSVVSITANVSIGNSGTIQASTGGTTSRVIDVISGTTTIVNDGTITQSAGTADGVIVVGANGTLNLTNSGDISSSVAGAAPISVTAGGTVGTFTNTGSIVNTADGVAGTAIDVSGDTAATTLTLGTGSAVTGSVILGGTAQDTINITGVGTIDGNIVGDATVGGRLDVDENFTYSSAATQNSITNITEIDVAAGKTFTLGNNQITATEQAVTISGTGVVDITGFTGTAVAVSQTGAGLTINSGATLSTDGAAVVQGNVTVSGAVSGTLTTTSSTITLNTGATVGAISGTANSNETLDIAGGNFTNAGAITGIDTIQVNGGGLTVSESITGINTLLDISGTRTMTVNNTVSGSGTLTLNGTLDIRAGQTVTMASLTADAGASSVLNSQISGTTNGQLVLTNGGGSFSATDFTFDIDSNVANGATYTIVDGTGVSLTAGTVSETSIIYDVALAATGDDLVATVTRNSLSSLALNGQNSGVGTALDGLVGSATGDLDTILDNLTSMSTQGEIDNALETLLPAVDGVGVVSIEAQSEAFNTISDRLAHLRYGDRGLATGDGMYADHMWLQAFGSIADQGERNGVAGFEASSYGLAIGVDSEDWVEDALVGVSFAWAAGNVDSEATSNAETDINSFQLAGYYSRDLEDGVYVDGMLGLAFNQYDGERRVNVGGFNRQLSSEYDGYQASARAAVGRYVKMGGNFQLIPEAAVQYTHLTIEDYTETGGGGTNLNVDPEARNALILSMGGTAAWDFEHAGGSVLRAETRAKYTYDAFGEEFSASSTFQGGGNAFTTEGAKVAQHGVVLGAGLKLLDAGGMEVSADYDATLKADFVNHSGQVKLRWAF
jgi:outer membrane autotransporter protein